MSSLRSFNGRKFDIHHIQTIVEVLSKGPASLDRFLKISVTCGDDPDIHFDRSVPPDPFKFTFLKDSQKFDLSLRGNIFHFVQEQGFPGEPFQTDPFGR